MDASARRLYGVVSRCKELGWLFETLQERASELHQHMPDHNPFIGGKYLANELPGFAIEYPWTEVRFRWEPEGYSADKYGVIIVSRKRIRDDMQPEWETVRRVKFDRLGNIAAKDISPAFGSELSLHDAEDLYHLLIGLVVIALNGEPVMIREVAVAA